MLSEKLLDDLLEDTAQELWNMEQHKKMQAEAVAMHDSPSLETMLQRMEEIEVSMCLSVSCLQHCHLVYLSIPYNLSRYIVCFFLSKVLLGQNLDGRP